jgi:DNA invertase Pin-like site-specific DNA recombinase
MHDFTARGIRFDVPTGHGASIDTTSPVGKPIFGMFATLAEFEQTKAGIAAARARGRNDGRPKRWPPPSCTCRGFHEPTRNEDGQSVLQPMITAMPRLSHNQRPL